MTGGDEGGGAERLERGAETAGVIEEQLGVLDRVVGGLPWSDTGEAVPGCGEVVEPVEHLVDRGDGLLVLLRRGKPPVVVHDATRASFELGRVSSVSASRLTSLIGTLSDYSGHIPGA